MTHIVKISNKPSDCGSYPLAYTHSESGEDWCCVLLKNVEYLSVDKDCPIVELKPKQLEWKSQNQLICSSNAGKHLKYSFIWQAFGDKNIYLNGKIIGQINNEMTKVDIENFCQNHYNNLFKEMIGE